MKLNVPGWKPIVFVWLRVLCISSSVSNGTQPLETAPTKSCFGLAKGLPLFSICSKTACRQFWWLHVQGTEATSWRNWNNFVSMIPNSKVQNGIFILRGRWTLKSQHSIRVASAQSFRLFLRSKGLHAYLGGGRCILRKQGVGTKAVSAADIRKRERKPGMLYPKTLGIWHESKLNADSSNLISNFLC